MVPRNGSQCSLSPYCVPGAGRGHLPTSLFSRGSDLPWATQLVSIELVFEPQPEMSEPSRRLLEEVCLLGLNVNRFCEAARHWACRRGRELPWGLEYGTGPLSSSPGCSWLLCQLVRLLSRDKTGIIDIIKYTWGPRRSA